MEVLVLISFALCLQCVLSQNKTKQSVKIVVLESTGAQDNGTTYYVRYLKPLLDMAMEDSNNAFGNYIDIHMKHIETLPGRRQIGALAAKEYYNSTGGVDVFFGPESNEGTLTLAYMILQWKLPLLTPRGNDEELRNFANFPLVVALHPFDKVELSKFIIKLFQHYKWKHISILVDERKDVMTSTGNIIKKLCEDESGVECYNHIVDCFNCSSGELDKALTKSKEESRINLLLMSIPDVRLLMIRASALGMLQKDFLYIVPDIGGVALSGQEVWRNDDSHDQLSKEAFRYVMLIMIKTPSQESFAPILKRLNERMFPNDTSKYVNATLEDEIEDNDPESLQKNTKVQQYILDGYYKSFLIYLTAVNETLAEGKNIRDSYALVRKMSNRTYTDFPVNGRNYTFHIGDQSNRVVDMAALAMLNESLGTFEIVVDYKVLNGNLTFTNQNYKDGWPQDGDKVLDTPTCGLKGQLCIKRDNSLRNALVAAFVIITTIICVSIGVILRLRHIHRMKNLFWWRIKPEELQSMKPHAARSTSFRQGQLTQIHTLPNINITINSGLLKEFEKIRDINHANVLRVFGACLEGERKVLITEYCQKGTLQMLLMDQSFKLDAVFSLSMLSDIVRALTYIHKHPVRVHGRLTSEVCMIDSRFSVKVGSYGLPSIYGSVKAINKSQDNSWLAPELLACPDKTQKGDIYSFGAIMSEVLSYDESYDRDHTVSQAIQTKHSQGSSKLQNSNKEIFVLESLMKECMSLEPELRPSLHRIHSIMHTLMLRTNQSGSLVDNLLQRLEKYSTNLERIVDEKVVELSHEKQRSEELLRQMLPTAVVDRLKSGLTVEPEFYDCVTIYFSDVVGFTDICSMLEPVQIVKLLNDLYSCFDEIIGHFDVYKVETIGDAYMVVSGLPTRNGNEHARQIARMSLVLLTAVTGLEPTNTPSRDRIKLRIGLNSGPVCAGVVGHKMPRYCLFGDAVNTASRMESNSSEMKIHMSASTAAILESFGTFRIESRGLVNIKGKGIMETFWLIGENVSDQQARQD